MKCGIFKHVLFILLLLSAMLGLRPLPAISAEIQKAVTTPFSIPNGGYKGSSYVYISPGHDGVPKNAVVTGIDAHFSATHPRSGDVQVYITDGVGTSDGLKPYYLWNNQGENTPNPSATISGITQFNGLNVDSYWYLVAIDTGNDGSGHINEWWMKIYYTTATGSGYTIYKADTSILDNLTTGTDANGDGYMETFGFLTSTDITAPNNTQVALRAICNETGQSWWASQYYNNDHAVIYWSDAYFTVTNNTNLTLKFELWDTNKINRLAYTTASGGPIMAGVYFNAYGAVENWIPGTDVDGDGFYDTYSFQIGVNGDVSAGPTNVTAKVICTTTGQSWWASAPWSITGDNVDWHYFNFTQKDFAGYLNENSTLNFTVELWDSTKTKKLATAPAFDTSILKIGKNPCAVAINNFAASNWLIDPYTGDNTNFTADITATPAATWKLNINDQELAVGDTNPVSQFWYGKNALGQILDPGTYTATLIATDPSGHCTDSKSVSITIDRKAQPQANSCEISPVIPIGSTTNLTTGDVSHSQTLFNLKGATLSASIELFYNSLSTYLGPLGPGWSHTYDIAVTENSDGSVLLREGNGGKGRYTKSGSNYISPPGDFSTLAKNGDGTYVIIYRDGHKYNFGIDGKLTSIVDRYSNSINLTYTGSDITGIADSAGRSIVFEYNTATNPHKLKKIAGPGIAVMDPDDKKFIFDYDANDRLWRVTNPNAKTTSTYREYWEYTYHPTGFLKTKRDTNNNVTSYDYWPDGRLKSSVDPEGQTTPAGHTRFLIYNNEPTTVKTATFTEKDGGVWTYAYDTSLGVLKQKMSPNPNQNAKPTTYYFYPDGTLKGYLKAKSEPFGDGEVRTTFFAYDSYGNQTKTTDPLKISDYPLVANPDTVNTSLFGTTGYPNWAIIYEYDYTNFDLLKSITDQRITPPAVTTFKNFTENGLKVTTVVDPENRGKIYRYNQSGTLKEIVDANNTMVAADGAVTEKSGAIKSTFEYYPTDPASSQYVAGRAGLLLRMHALDNVIATYSEYDVNGNIKKINITDKNGVAVPVDTSLEYDALNRIMTTTKKSTSLPKAFDDIVTSFDYDPVQNLLSITDAMQYTTRYKKNYQGQVIKITDAKQKDTIFTFSGSGCASCGGESGGVDKLTGVYDPRVTSKTPLEAQPHTAFQYDKLGRLEYETDPLLKKLHYTYYDNGLVKEKYDATISPEKRLITYVYNNRGQLTDKTFADNSSDHYTYLADGTLETATSRDKDNAIVISYTYTWYKNGWIKSVVDNSGRKVSYDLYDGIGQRKQVTILQGSSDQRTIVYDYDSVNRPWHITSPAGTFTYSYDKLGRRYSLTYPNNPINDPNNNITDYRSNDLDQLTSLTHSAVSGSAFLTYGYTEFDKVGNRKTRTGTSPQSYDYDELYRLTQAVTGKGTENFTYDEAGNRLKGPGFKDTAYVHNEANQATTGRRLQYAYDNLGSQTDRIIPGAPEKSWTLGWDYENRLIQAEKIKGSERKTVTFKYDPFGRRIEKKIATLINGVTTTSTYGYVYDNENIAQETLTTDTTTTKTYYTHGPGIDEPLALERGGSFYYYHTDGQGSIMAITNAARQAVQSYEYESFGLVKPATNFANSYTFTGREWDKETGLYYYRARYYDPMEGRFIQKDPIGFAGGINLYAYVQNNPVNAIDPSGLATVVVIGHETRSNPFGHVAIGFTGQGVYSYGTKTPLGSSLTDYLAKQATYRDSTVYTITTTPEQEATMLADILKYRNIPLPDPRKDLKGAFKDTCNTRTQHALDAGGVISLLFTSPFPGDTEFIVSFIAKTSMNIPKGGAIPSNLSIFNK